MSAALVSLAPDNPTQPFPPVEQALKTPNGLLAIGGCLSSQRLRNAYYQGIFPWYSDDEPLLWWSPDPRLVLFPEALQVSRSMQKIMRRELFQITYDQAFSAVIDACAQPRTDDTGTWITDAMREAYCDLHVQGIAHSAEAWQGNQLVGGLYGIGIGQVFFGESMFTRRSNASKAAFIALIQAFKCWNYALIDCQVYTRHLASFGAVEIPREAFVRLLRHHRDQPVSSDAWY